MYNVTQNFVQESAVVDRLDQLCDTGSLKGKVFQAKMMTPDRLKGLVSLSASAFAISNLGYLTLVIGGPMFPIVGAVATAAYGMSKFDNNGTISAINMIENNQIEITI